MLASLDLPGARESSRLMNAGESMHYCQPKCVLVILVATCVVSVLLASRSFNSRIRWGGFLLRGSTTSAISGILPSPTTHGGLEWQASIPPNTSLRDHDLHRDLVDFDPHQDLVDFDPRGNDTLVVLHTQKTGGTEFIRHLVTLQRDGRRLCLPAVKEVQKRHKVRKKAKRSVKHQIPCPRDPANPDGEQWLIAAKTVRWVCGLHATYNEYKHCLPTLNNPKINPHRHLHYTILLRHPIMRYLSEYLHMQRNATWAAAKHLCNGKLATMAEMPPCYPGYYLGKPWVNMTLSEFVSCDSNWANNRQTMMLADLESVHCFNRSAMSSDEREKRLLETAKKNLRSFSFLGMTEYMVATCQLFEKTFRMTFAALPEPYNSLSEFRSGPLLVNLQNNAKLYNAILQTNHLDVQLYEFALGLFTERAGRAGISVNRDFIGEEVQRLMENPSLLDSVIGKRNKLNYRV